MFFSNTLLAASQRTDLKGCAKLSFGLLRLPKSIRARDFIQKNTAVALSQPQHDKTYDSSAAIKTYMLRTARTSTHSSELPTEQMSQRLIAQTGEKLLRACQLDLAVQAGECRCFRYVQGISTGVLLFGGLLGCGAY